MLFTTSVLFFSAGAVLAQLSESSIKAHVGTLDLSANFNPIKESYWTGLPHHRRTPFAVSPDGKSAYLAYLDASQTDVHIQQVDPSSFVAVGSPVTVSGGKEAGGLIAHNDGFALLTNEAMPSGTVNAPPANTPVAVIYRYTSGKQIWKTYLGGPDNVGGMGALASPDMNGDLVYSESAGMYGAYFVVTAYSGSAKGHFGDAIQYVNDNGTLEQISGASSAWGCSHNTGIAFEAADSVPFASLCAEDQGAIWLNTGGTGMDKRGVKVSNENVQNGASNEPMGGMSGSFSNMARFINSGSYIFTWVSRGAKDLTTNEWMGSGYTKSANRTVNRNVAIATFSDKKTLVGEQATSVLGPDGDKQVTWITSGSADAQNAHVATFDGSSALVTWEEIANPTCEFIAMGCKGTFTGSYFQLVKDGKKVGEPVKFMDIYIAGDMVTMADGRICWPYVDMKWTLDGPVRSPANVKAISFACASIGTSVPTESTSSVAGIPSSSTAPAQSPVAPQAPSSVIEGTIESTLSIDASTSALVAPVPTSQRPVPTSQRPVNSAESFSATASSASVIRIVTTPVSQASPASAHASESPLSQSPDSTGRPSSAAVPQASANSTAPLQSAHSITVPVVPTSVKSPCFLPESSGGYLIPSNIASKGLSWPNQTHHRPHPTKGHRHPSGWTPRSSRYIARPTGTGLADSPFGHFEAGKYIPVVNATQTKPCTLIKIPNPSPAFA